jgi:hypothetical protein
LLRGRLDIVPVQDSTNGQWQGSTHSLPVVLHEGLMPHSGKG